LHETSHARNEPTFTRRAALRGTTAALAGALAGQALRPASGWAARAAARSALALQTASSQSALTSKPRIIGVNEPFLECLNYPGENLNPLLASAVKSIRVETAFNAVRAAKLEFQGKRFTNMTCVVGNGQATARCLWRAAGGLAPPLRSVFTGAKKEEWELATLKEIEECASLGSAVAVIEIANEMWKTLGGSNPEEARVYGAMCAGLLQRWQKRQERRKLPAVALVASANYREPGASWLFPMLESAPALKTLLGGLAFDPYGAARPNQRGLRHMVQQQRAVERSAGLKMSNPYVYVTEYGVEANGLRGFRQTEETEKMFALLKQFPWVRGVWYFSLLDQPEDTGNRGLGHYGWYPRAHGGQPDFSAPRQVMTIVEQFAEEASP
jgi:hypothetical protein